MLMKDFNLRSWIAIIELSYDVRLAVNKNSFNPPKLGKDMITHMNKLTQLHTIIKLKFLFKLYHHSSLGLLLGNLLGYMYSYQLPCDLKNCRI